MDADTIPQPDGSYMRIWQKAGIKFNFVTNARNHNAGNFNYCSEMAKQCGFTKEDIFIIKKN